MLNKNCKMTILLAAIKLLNFYDLPMYNLINFMFKMPNNENMNFSSSNGGFRDYKFIILIDYKNYSMKLDYFF